MIIPPGFASVAIPIRHTSLARSAIVTFGVDSTNWPGDYVDMCDRIAADFDSVWSVTMDTEVSLGPVQAAIGQDGSENLSVEGTFTWTGDNASASLPPNSNLLIRKITTRGGRRGRGRLFIPWLLGEGSVDDVGLIAGATVTANQGRANDWLDAMNLDPGATPMVVLHSPSAEDVENPTATGAPNVVTSLVVDSLIGSQRRRLGR